MKRLILITGIILISCVLIQSFAQIPQAPSPAPAVSESTQVSAPKRFVLKSVEGRLAVFRKGEGQPIFTTDTLTAMLPRQDRLRLEQGVEVEGEPELRKTLEDYCS